MIDYSRIPSPCYVIDEERLRKNLGIIKHVADASGAEIILAFKGFAMWSVFPVVREYVSGAAASSIHEARLCYEEMGVPAHTYAPAFRSEEFGTIMRYSSHVTFNSLAQYRKFAPVLQRGGKHISPGLRINPEYSEIAHGIYNPCSPGSRLGVTAGELSGGLPEGVEGLHFHVLFESDSYTLEKVLAVVEKKFGHLLPKLKWLNMGGGHLMTGKNYDTDHLISLLKRFREKHGIHIILEPGSAFAWETGELVTTVEDIIDRDGIKTAILDVSFTAHMPDCLEMPYKPVIIGAFEPVAGKPAYRMGGNSCLSGDFMGDWSFHRELEVGDRLVFWDMIHYTMVKTTTFNGVPHPHIGIWTADQKFRLVREFGYEDYRDRLS
ncbi:MAG TPA: carboxynorspermidine decarboxylase [Bacteroidales bacterium]|jgi:carboxynorspermidine decarboxylase|nr:carboxynorspermidine decarboxylase [Bacteroidales bacterium]OPZ53607.1 MAG: Carboxynorspermidine/carboxyspermidine decarboxylase [Bacteroidetes bacterium ADurb.BinA012]MBK7731633.1 carboxynorspermidine decarboxylase [Bacteroidales bacterium]MBP7035773.1 carboxynorspermidine decarboxylase [Bacteroidales bacterium]MBP8708964.1 carboxynorspermidine decarboxylase [Bacteroidales bacterium]